MADILNITGLGKLEIVETYVYYDQPVLFSCKSAAGHLYLGVAADKNDEHETWLYVGVSAERLNLIQSGAIDLHDAFAEPEDSFLLQEIVPYDDQTQPRLERIQSDQISEDMLPMQGERLDLKTDTLPALSSLGRGSEIEKARNSESNSQFCWGLQNRSINCSPKQDSRRVSRGNQHNRNDSRWEETGY